MEKTLRSLLFFGLMLFLGAADCYGPGGADGGELKADPKDGSLTPPHLTGRLPSGGDVPGVAKTPTEFPKFENEACQPVFVEGVFSKSNCDEGLTCWPDSLSEQTQGKCRLSCLEIKDEGGKLLKSKTPEVCPDGRSCIGVSEPDLSDIIGAFCLNAQPFRDEPCLAFKDENACADGMGCQVSNQDQNEAGEAEMVLTCRSTCRYGVDTDDVCAEEEVCLPAQFGDINQNIQKSDTLPFVICNQAVCEAGNEACECNLGEGYACKPLLGNFPVCVQEAGWCGSPVPWAGLSDLITSELSGKICNEIDAHMYCDRRLWDDVERPGSTFCVPVTQNSNAGFCNSICSVPSVDRNGDGKVEGQEVGLKANCPANYECDPGISKLMGRAIPVGDPLTGEPKLCDPEKCEEGVPCEAECGPGDAECFASQAQDGSTIHRCLGFIGSCEAVVHEENADDGEIDE